MKFQILENLLDEEKSLYVGQKISITESGKPMNVVVLSISKERCKVLGEGKEFYLFTDFLKENI